MLRTIKEIHLLGGKADGGFHVGMSLLQAAKPLPLL